MNPVLSDASCNRKWPRQGTQLCPSDTDLTFSFFGERGGGGGGGVSTV